MQIADHNRLVWLDQLKGFTIILVVVGHILFESHKNNFSTWSFIYLFHMPLFFMLSGMLAYKMNDNPFLKNCAAKARSLLLPYIFTGGMYCLFFFNASVRDMYMKANDGGYWFVWVLFWITCLFLCTQIVYKYLKRLLSKIFDNLFCELLILLLPHFLLLVLDYYELIPTLAERIFSVSYILEYYRYFILGYFLGKYLGLDKIVRNQVSIFVLMLAFVLIIYINAGDFYKYDILYTLIPFILCLAVYAVLRANSDKIQRRFPQLSYIGSRSLDIYLLHFFFLGLGSNTGWTYFPIYIDYWFWELIAQLVLAAILICASIVAGNIIRSNKYAALLFLGQKLKIPVK